MQNVNIVLPSVNELTLIKQYLHLSRSVHGLTDAEINFVSILIRNAKEENGNLEEVLSLKGRVRLRDELDMTIGSLNTNLSRLRKKGVIVNNSFTGILKGLVYDKEGCELLITFKLNAEPSKEIN